MRRLEPSSVLISGLVGGVALVVAQALLMPLFDRTSPLLALRTTAALLLGDRVLTTMDAGPLLAAAVVTILVSIFCAFLLDLVCRLIDVGPAVLLGVPYGIVLYLFHCYGLAAFVPWLEVLQGWGMLFAYLIYGLVTAGCFEALHLRYARRRGIPVPTP
jgi:hypothetical protein